MAAPTAALATVATRTWTCAPSRSAVGAAARVATPRVRPTRASFLRTAAAAKASDDASTESTSTDKASDPSSKSPEMYDNLAKIFLNRKEEDWLGLLASSEQWPQLKDGFFARLKVRAAEEEDPEEMLRVSRVLRLLQGTSDRVMQHAALLEEVQSKDEDLWEGMVTSRRAEFTTEFFQFIRFKLEALVRADAAKGGTSSSPRGGKTVTADERAALKGEREDAGRDERDADKKRDDLARLASVLLTICEAFDEATKDQQTLEDAADNFKELLEVETLEEMNTKIDEMQAQGKMDPAMVLTAAKAYMSVKESPYVEEEVKDVMAHLYFKMKETMGRQQPKEVRILKYLLSIEDPQEIRKGLEEAFTPGPELTVGDEDYLFCEAPVLLQTIETVLKAYDAQKGKANITGQAAELMQPEVIEKMKTVKFQIEAHFM